MGDKRQPGGSLAALKLSQLATRQSPALPVGGATLELAVATARPASQHSTQQPAPHHTYSPIWPAPAAEDTQQQPTLHSSTKGAELLRPLSATARSKHRPVADRSPATGHDAAAPSGHAGCLPANTPSPGADAGNTCAHHHTYADQLLALHLHYQTVLQAAGIRLHTDSSPASLAAAAGQRGQPSQHCHSPATPTSTATCCSRACR